MLTIKSGKKAVPIPETEKELKRIGKLWIQRARYKLDNAKPFEAKGTGKLRASMKTKVFVERNQPNVDITPSVTYWEFVDMGSARLKIVTVSAPEKKPVQIHEQDASTRANPQVGKNARASIPRRKWKIRHAQHDRIFDSKVNLLSRSQAEEIHFRHGQALMDKYFERVVSAYMRDLENATKTDT